MVFDSNSTGMRIRHYRNLKRLSQEKLAELTGVSQEHIAKIEAGVNVPSLELLISIANALDVSSDDLLSDNLSARYSEFDKEYHEIFSDCTSDERSILIRTLRFLKALLSEYGI